jgi:hypothetical protein
MMNDVIAQGSGESDNFDLQWRTNEHA